MQLAERIMRELAEGALLTRQLAARLDSRAQVILAACRCLRHKGLVHTIESMHGLTRAGKALLEQGGFIPCQRKGRAAGSAGRTLRQRAWTVMRMADHFSVDSLLQTVSDGDERNAENNLRNYCRALHRAGLLGRTARSGDYFLRREMDSGPPSGRGPHLAFSCVSRPLPGRHGPHGGAHSARAGAALPSLRRPLGPGYLPGPARGPHAHLKPLCAPAMAGVPELQSMEGRIMLSQDLTSCAASVGALAGTVTEEQERFLRLLQENLLACAEQARWLENRAGQEAETTTDNAEIRA